MKKKEIFIKKLWNYNKGKSSYWLTRFVFLRLLGFVYLFAFLSLVFQVIPLIGENGLLPADNYIESIESRHETKTDAFIQLPTIFYWGVSDKSLLIFSWIGAIMSFLLLIGFANSILLFLMWFLYMSFVNIGQLWYSFGWEIQLLETGFLAIFICPFLDWKPFPKTAPPTAVIWLLRWLAFRISLGSGLIKLRGDSCWRELTCLFYHYETQPIPNPLSPYFHFLPRVIHKLGVLFDFFVQLVAPFFIFWPRIGRHIAGILLISFQFVLILSGNLSFLNWLTILPIIGCFDDSFFRRILPRFIVKKADEAAKNARPIKYQQIISWILVIMVAFLSISVIQNLMSSRQAMNTSFDRLHLVNTYGAFGSVGKVRNELIIQGTQDSIITPETEWKEYEFKAKPGDVYRKPPILGPYHLRLDWLIWFAAMATPNRYPFVPHLVWKLLHNDEDAISLIASNPFPDEPPKIIRVELYRYEFLPPGHESGAVWERQRIGEWLPPLSVDTPGLRGFISGNRWNTYD